MGASCGCEGRSEGQEAPHHNPSQDSNPSVQPTGEGPSIVWKDVGEQPGATDRQECFPSAELDTGI